MLIIPLCHAVACVRYATGILTLCVTLDDATDGSPVANSDNGRARLSNGWAGRGCADAWMFGIKIGR